MFTSVINSPAAVLPASIVIFRARFSARFNDEQQNTTYGGPISVFALTRSARHRALLRGIRGSTSTMSIIRRNRARNTHLDCVSRSTSPQTSGEICHVVVRGISPMYNRGVIFS